MSRSREGFGSNRYLPSSRYRAVVPLQVLHDITIYWERGGSGERLLFISGTGGDLRNKPSPMEGPLVAAFDVLAYDQRGLGQSSVPDGPYSMAGYADDAAALLDALGWDTCLVVGVSFGGMVAQELAIRHPARVRRLVLACTSSGGEGGASYPLHELAELQGEARAIRQLEILDTRWDAAWRLANQSQWQTMVEGFSAYLNGATAVSPERQQGAARQLDARRRHDTTDRLARIACPTLVCGGRFDGIAPPANSAFLAAAIPGAAVAYFDGGHQFFLQDPTAFPLMVEFLGALS
jgi:3-oxoadipate enol-lactonase